MIEPEIGEVNKHDESYHGDVVVDISAVDCAHTGNCKVKIGQAGEESEGVIFVVSVGLVAINGKYSLSPMTAC